MHWWTKQLPEGNANWRKIRRKRHGIPPCELGLGRTHRLQRQHWANTIAFGYAPEPHYWKHHPFWLQGIEKSVSQPEIFSLLPTIHSSGRYSAGFWGLKSQQYSYSVPSCRDSFAAHCQALVISRSGEEDYLNPLLSWLKNHRHVDNTAKFD